MAEAVSLDGLIGRTDWDEFTWIPFRPGVRAHWLYRSGGDGPEAALLRYDPGAAVPLHEHTGWEHIFVLAGAQSDGTRSYAAGALLASPPGSRHAVASPEGCIVLAIWQRAVRFVSSLP